MTTIWFHTVHVIALQLEGCAANVSTRRLPGQKVGHIAVCDRSVGGLFILISRMVPLDIEDEVETGVESAASSVEMKSLDLSICLGLRI